MIMINKRRGGGKQEECRGEGRSGEEEENDDPDKMRKQLENRKR